jgi:ring-1,2-phenylacetyl-CoA epoxidase subunit PaaB
LKSLDPRVVRLPALDVESPLEHKPQLDQLGTFEVFVQAKEGKPFQHEGSIHAPDLEMAFILAKESLTRRFQAISLFVTDTRNVMVSTTTEGDQNAYDTIPDASSTDSKMIFEIFHLPKRGKQHIYAGAVNASSVEEAFAEAKKKFGAVKVYNVWAVPSDKIRFTLPEEKDLWKTLPDKKFRDAAEYKGGDKLKEYLQRRSWEILEQHKKNENRST